MTSSTNLFQYDGHDLLHWLRELVCRDIDRRQAALDALNQIRDRVPTPDAADAGAAFVVRQGRFNAEVRQVLAQPDADAAGYVRRLTDLLREVDAERMDVWRQEQARADRVTDRLMAQMRADSVSEERRQSLQRRLGRVIRSGCDDRGGLARRQSKLMEQLFVAGQVHSALGPLVMHAPDAIRAQLHDRHEAWRAATVIEKLGPLAAAFADDLFVALDAGWVAGDSRLVEATAAAVRDSGNHIARLLSWLTDDREGVAAGAACVLCEVGSRAAELAPTAVPTLLALATAPGTPARPVVIEALGAVAAGDESVVPPLLELSHDPDVWVRGPALTALGSVGRRADLVVPRLIAAFDDYEEPDPDWNYHSNHARVVYALQAFGADAAPAVPALIARIHPPGDDMADVGVIKTLAAIGPAAAAALPALCALAEECGYDLESADPDPIPRAIRSIRGQA